MPIHLLDLSRNLLDYTLTDHQSDFHSDTYKSEDAPSDLSLLCHETRLGLLACCPVTEGFKGVWGVVS
jgi:hypothetical protein